MTLIDSGKRAILTIVAVVPPGMSDQEAVGMMTNSVSVTLAVPVQFGVQIVVAQPPDPAKNGGRIIA